MGRYFDTTSAVATVATSATETTADNELSQKSQKSQGARAERTIESNIIDLRDAFEERAAIMEFEGEMPRAEAEHQAALDTGFHMHKPTTSGTNNQTLDPSLAPRKGKNDNERA